MWILPGCIEPQWLEESVGRAATQQQHPQARCCHTKQQNSGPVQQRSRVSTVEASGGTATREVPWPGNEQLLLGNAPEACHRQWLSEPAGPEAP